MKRKTWKKEQRRLFVLSVIGFAWPRAVTREGIVSILIHTARIDHVQSSNNRAALCQTRDVTID